MKLIVLRGSTLLLSLFFIAACSNTPAAPTTTMTYDKQYNFSGAHKIYIEPSSRTDAATIMISDAQIRRIDAVLAAELGLKGFTVVSDSSQADLFLNWYLATEDPVKAKAADCDGCDMMEDGGYRYSKGTLSVDMVDPMRNQAVWRSVLKTELTGDPDSAGAEQARQAAAAAVFARFPPQ